MKPLIFGLAAGAGFQAWRNLPPDGPVTTSTAWLVLIVAVGCAYLVGRWRGRHGAGAVAVATATAVAESTAVSTSSAQQTVQVAVVMPGAGAGSAGVAGLGTELPSWVQPVGPALDPAALLDGLDVEELLSEQGIDPVASERSERTG